MEALTNYNYSGHNFIVWFFRILAVMFATMLALVFALRINETITIREGEIVAAAPQVDYKAPFEAQMVKIFVTEGQPVKAGDTLMRIQSLDLSEQHAKLATEVEYLQKKLESISVLQHVIQEKKTSVDRSLVITNKKYQLDKQQMLKDIRLLKQQYKLQKERLRAANEKFAADSVLLRKDMLSKFDYNNTKDANLAMKEEFSRLLNQQEKQLTDNSLLDNEFMKERNALFLAKVQLDENLQALLQSKNDYESQLIQSQEALKKVDLEMKKQTLIAGNPGIVNFLFNTRQTTNIISKGELLVSVAPRNISYYAKVVVPEKDMPEVKAGFDAQLKMDAYHQLQNGWIKGRVSYVGERKENGKFYALVQLPRTDRFRLKSGYSIYGEIITDRMPLYRYFVKKLLK